MSTISHLLIHTVDVQTEAQSKSATGGAVTTWTNKAATVRARVEQLKGDVMEAYGRLGWTVTNLIYFDADYGIVAAKDRIVFGVDAFYVKQVNAAHGQSATPDHWEVLAERKPL